MSQSIPVLFPWFETHNSIHHALKFLAHARTKYAKIVADNLSALRLTHRWHCNWKMNVTDNSAGFVGSLDRRLFWDVDIADIDEERHKRFIIQRVLERGGLEDWRLLKRHYTIPAIAAEAQMMRSLEPHALAFIACIADLPRESFRCYISKQLNQKHWSC